MESCWEKIWESEKSSSDEGEDVESLILLSCNENQRVHLCMARGCYTGREAFDQQTGTTASRHTLTYVHTHRFQSGCLF